MADREMTPEEMRAVELLMQLQALSPEDAPTAVRVSLRMPDGSYVGEALLSADAVDALNDSTLAMVAYRDTQAPFQSPQAEQAPVQTPAAAMDAMLVADYEKYFTGLDADGLLSMAGADPKGAVADFDEITGFDQDGDVL
ncbi:hypothetical protein [Streptomyces gardneri]|uniref:hypothetical protein n=1 Tax=Streptomyces gardneri TaxID=66892 RepID=UPI0035DC0B67